MLEHRYPFDPSYGHTLASLLEVRPPPEPEGFAEFWSRRYREALSVDPEGKAGGLVERRQGWEVRDFSSVSTGGTPLRGWLLTPERGPVRRAFVVGHGYGGREAPDTHLPLKEAALLFPCSRGLGRSLSPSIPADPGRHVLHGIERPESYVLGGCIEDVWTSATALLQCFPEAALDLGYLGISFGGGVGMMALAWDPRFSRAHVNVPSFGHQALRLELPTLGSGAAVRARYRRDPSILETLLLHDAAVAARRVSVPVHGAYALFDPAVAPPGQFSIHNALGGRGSCFVLTAGHHPYPGQVAENRRLLQEIDTFFDADLGAPATVGKSP